MADDPRGPREQVVIATVGILIPDEPEFHGPAYNRAGQLFQRGLVEGLRAAGARSDVVLSIEPLPAFPRSRRLFGRRGQFLVGGSVPVRLLPFVNIHPLKWLTAGLSTAGALMAWSWAHRGQRRLINCVNLTMPPGMLILLAARLSRTPVLASVLDVFRPGGLVPDTLYRRLDFRLQRWLLPRFDGWMVVSQAIADDLLPGRAVCRLEGGIAADRFQTAPRADRGDGAFRIVSAGGLEPYNGTQLILAALPYLPDNCEVVFAGTGSLARDVQAAVERDHRVRYHGFLDFEQVLDLYRSADLLLNMRVTKALDTRYFFPSKLMEYLASGVPVLSTCTGHVEEEFGQIAYLLREETPQALADSVRQIAAIPGDERRALGARARAFMLREKTWERQGEKLLAYIGRVVLKDQERG